MRDLARVGGVAVSLLISASLLLSACGTMPGYEVAPVPDPPAVATDRCGPVADDVIQTITDSMRVGEVSIVGGPTVDMKGRRYWVSRWVRLDKARFTAWAAIEDEGTGTMWIAARVSGQHSLATRPDSYVSYSGVPPDDWRVLNQFSSGVLFAVASSPDGTLSVYWDEAHDYRTRLTDLLTGLVDYPDAEVAATLAVCTGYRGGIGPWGSRDYWIWDVPWSELQ